MQKEPKRSVAWNTAIEHERNSIASGAIRDIHFSPQFPNQDREDRKNFHGLMKILAEQKVALHTRTRTNNEISVAFLSEHFISINVNQFHLAISVLTKEEEKPEEEPVPCDVGNHVCDHQYLGDLGKKLLCRSAEHKKDCPFKEAAQ